MEHNEIYFDKVSAINIQGEIDEALKQISLMEDDSKFHEGILLSVLIISLFLGAASFLLTAFGSTNNPEIQKTVYALCTVAFVLNVFISTKYTKESVDSRDEIEKEIKILNKIKTKYLKVKEHLMENEILDNQKVYFLFDNISQTPEGFSEKEYARIRSELITMVVETLKWFDSNKELDNSRNFFERISYKLKDFYLKKQSELSEKEIDILYSLFNNLKLEKSKRVETSNNLTAEEYTEAFGINESLYKQQDSSREG